MTCAKPPKKAGAQPRKWSRRTPRNADLRTIATRGFMGS